jgi:hypothetical protein
MSTIEERKAAIREYHQIRDVTEEWYRQESEIVLAPLRESVRRTMQAANDRLASILHSDTESEEHDGET